MKTRTFSIDKQSDSMAKRQFDLPASSHRLVYLSIPNQISTCLVVYVMFIFQASHLCVSIMVLVLGCADHLMPGHLPYCSSCSLCWRLERCATAEILCLISAGHFPGDKARRPCGLGILYCFQLVHQPCSMACRLHRLSQALSAYQNQFIQRWLPACCSCPEPCRLLD